MKEKIFLGIDLGTTSCKAALVNHKGEILAKASEKYSLYVNERGKAEQDPHEWWNSIIKVINKIVNETKISFVDAISITGQWSGTVAVDKEGEPLMNAIIWLDSRGEKYVRSLIKGYINLFGYDIFKIYYWLRKTGGAPSKSGKDSLAHILFIKNEFPEIYSKVYKFLEPISYINFKLTGKFVASYDIMITHWVTDNRDVSNVRYDDKLLKISGIEKEKLPQLVRSYDVIGNLRKEAARELGLNEGIPIIAGGGDIQTSLIGAGCVENFEAFAYFGTSSWLTSHVPFKKTDVFNNIASLPSALPGKYFIAAEQECAGKCFDFLSNLLSINIEEMDKLASLSRIGSNGLIFTPWLYGERAPVEDKYLRGILFNISLENKKEDFVRSIYEGVCLNMKWILRPVERLMGKVINRIRLGGGCAKSKIFSNILADVLGIRIEVIEEPQFVNAKGAAFLAAFGIKHLRLNEISKLAKISSVIDPNYENFKRYEKIFKSFLSLYKSNKKLFRNLY